MSKLRVEGGKVPEGTVRVQGAKNAALPILAATVLNGGENIIHNCPCLTDVDYTIEILRGLGCTAVREEDTVIVNSADMYGFTISEELMRKIRSSIIFMGAIAARTGRAAVSIPGGCNIGSRPIDLHLKALRQLGMRIKEENGYICCFAERLEGAHIYLDFPSVGATENIMLAACTAHGTTIISNAAREPEIADLECFLNRMGARVSGGGGSVIRIDGVNRLSGGTEHTIIPDRIAGATYLAMCAAAHGAVELTNVLPGDMSAMLCVMKDMGAEFITEKTRVIMKPVKRLMNIPTIRTMPYPGFPTDIQPPFMAMSCTAEGTAVFTETIFENRFRHAAELSRMGADITLHGRTAVVRGGGRLCGVNTEAYDLRGGSAMLTAALAAEGVTVIDNADYIDRGYEAIEKQLTGLGVEITRIRE